VDFILSLTDQAPVMVRAIQVSINSLIIVFLNYLTIRISGIGIFYQSDTDDRAIVFEKQLS